MKNPQGPDSEQLVEVIVKGIEEKKGQNVTIMDLREIEHAVTDFFVICDGNSNTQVKAIADSIEEEVRKGLNDKPWHKEGKEESEWVLLDYVNVVAHVFQRPIREFYNIEELWGDAEIREIEVN
ncbi:ribosome silencing factor [Cryomorphaceae bacterium]|jgi:ribosome-associated protein|nr:ribosome silencing factor [Cryomorphaceae bacterium]